MTSLRELQLAFAEALIEPPSPKAAALVVAAGIPAERRLQVYCNNFRANLCGALEAVFPVVRRLVGDDFFGYAARGYAGEVPSVAGDIHAFGATFPQYLAELPAARRLAYLPDVARLEWAYHQVFHAAGVQPLGVESLAAVAAGYWLSLRLVLSPASALLQSPYPVLRIWQVNQDGWAGEATVVLDQGGENVLVWRQDGEVALLALRCGELALLTALAEGRPLEQALDAALGIDAEFDLGATLQRHFDLGIFVGLRVS